MIKTKKIKDFSKNYKKPAFTLIEALTVLFIFSLITVTFYSVFSLGTRYIQDAKNRLGAVAIANEKMEIIRNLKYEDIGTVNGIPDGDISMDEDVSENTRLFHVKTFIQYVDDPFDGVAPADTVPNDYKKVKITVSWSGSVSSGSVFLASNFSPQGVEIGSGDGTLAINVSDGQGEGVAQASIHIVNNSLSPNININAQTDSAGKLLLPGAKESEWGYAITVSKNNYETVETIDRNDVTYIPVFTHASVWAGQLNTKDIIINLLADLKIKSVDSLGDPIANLSFKLKGGRILGTDTTDISDIKTIYNLNIDGITESDGEKDLDNISPPQYFLSEIGSVDGQTLVGIKGASFFKENVYTIPILPDESKTVEIKFANNDSDSLLVKIKKSDGTAIGGAEVKVKNDSGYETTQTSGVDGFAFFPDTGNLFSPGDYTIEVKVAGFSDKNETVNVDKLTVKEIELTAI